MSQKYIVANENGERIHGAKVILPEQLEAIESQKKKIAVIGRSKAPFVFTEMGALKGALSKMKNKELGYFLLMQTYVDYNNMLKSAPLGKLPMTNKELAEALNVTPKTVSSLMKKFEKMEVIHRDTVELYGKSHKAFFINSDYCFRTGVGGQFSKNKVDKAVKIFIGSLQEAFSQGLQPADIGFIYKSIQFIHYETNLLVTNPQERDLYRVKTLSLEVLAELLNLSIEETSRKLSYLQWNGMFVYAKTKVGKELMVKANPFLLYRKPGELEETLGAEFIVNRG
ncbi:helix-turn-helix domain-containing protein [Peribacillus butanolivorans]|uniref:helix-turn-helix domain-containing protein n=1 Tax=Peribacillus butanolivorans TaxID=421767 RepID=UPI00366F8FAC